MTRIQLCFKVSCNVTSLVIQWLGLHASTAGGKGSIPGRGPKIPQAGRHGKKKKKKKNDKIFYATVDQHIFETGNRCYSSKMQAIKIVVHSGKLDGTITIGEFGKVKGS